MKRLIVAGVLMIMPCIAWSVTMCARDDVLAISLVPGIDGTGSTYNAAEYTWRANFSYGTILGEATCLSAAEGGEGSRRYAITNARGETLSYDIPKGLHGTDDDGNGRVYCWCRMTHPVLSRWVYREMWGSYWQCTESCTWYCLGSNGCANNASMRSALFNAVGK